MNDLSFKLRVLLYLYSTRNIVACLVALAGPTLLFAGVIRAYWLPITAGLYVLGYLFTPPPRQIDAQLTRSLSMSALIEQLDALIAQAKPHLDTVMSERLNSIRTSVMEVLPRLQQDAQGSGDLFTVRQTVTRYLPEAIGSYVALPRAFRTTHPLQNGKTAQALLSEQLNLLDDELHNVVANLAKGEAQALLVNGEFLESKFRERDFLKTA